MIQSNRARQGGRVNRGPRIHGAGVGVGVGVAVVGLAALLSLAACGGGKSAGAGTSPSAGPSASSTSNGATGGRPAIPTTFGIAADVAPGRIEVQDPASGQTTVTYTAATTFTQQKTVTEAALTPGVCIAAVQARPATATSPTPSTSPKPSAAAGTPISVTATTITITTPVGGSCTPVGGRGGFGAGGSARPTAASSRLPTGNASNRGGAGWFTALVSGKVTTVAGTTIAVQSTDRRTQQVVNDTVKVTAATRYVETVSTTSSAVAIGECIQAVGPADSTGAVAATRIGISTAVNGTCVSGLGGRGPGFPRAGQSAVTGG
jgi:hypothetical protein